MARLKNLRKKKTITLPDNVYVKTDYAVDVENLSVRYEVGDTVVRAVNSIDIKLKKGSVLGIVGETGAGKTTAMLSLMHLVPDPPGIVDCDRLIINGIDMSKLTSRELGLVRGKDIAMIFQDPMTSLNPVMTIGEQIAESIVQHEAVSIAEAMKSAMALLETVGIPASRVREYPHQFSGGMRQRVGIAIALACRPAVLIADEPTTALDVTIQAQVLKLMRELKEQYDTSMILITHDLGIVAQMCDEIAVMYAGRIIERGTVEDVYERYLHPYTEGLFKSLPNINRRVQRLLPIRGQMPDPTNLPVGCAFMPRCPYAGPMCENNRLDEKAVTKTHGVLCAAYDDPEFVLKGEAIYGGSHS